MKIPARLSIVNRLSAIDPILTQEIVGQIFQPSSLNLRSDECTCLNFCQAVLEYSFSLPAIGSAGGFRERLTITAVLYPPYARSRSLIDTTCSLRAAHALPPLFF